MILFTPSFKKVSVSSCKISDPNFLKTSRFYLQVFSRRCIGNKVMSVFSDDKAQVVTHPRQRSQAHYLPLTTASYSLVPGGE